MREKLMRIFCSAAISCVAILNSACATQTPPPIQNVRTPESILSVLQAHRESIYKVHNQYQETSPDLAGRVIMRLTIAPDGHVAANDIVQSTFDNVEFTNAIRQKVNSVNFGVVRDPISMSFDFPLEFRARGPAPLAPPFQRSYRR